MTHFGVVWAVLGGCGGCCGHVRICGGHYGCVGIGGGSSCGIRPK